MAKVDIFLVVMMHFVEERRDILCRLRRESSLENLFYLCKCKIERQSWVFMMSQPEGTLWGFFFLNRKKKNILNHFCLEGERESREININNNKNQVFYESKF